MAASLAFLLAACQSIPDTDESALAARPLRQCGGPLALAGRVSVNYTRDREEQMESLHGKFTWQQAGEKTRIRFFSPLGQSVAAIDVTSEKAVFTASGKQPVAAPDADALTFRQLGWPLPVSGMRNWLQGCATDAAGQVFKASSARPEVTTRDGWRIHYLDWSAFGESERVPRRVDMTHTPAAPAAVSSINIRLVIDEWHTENEDAF